MPEHSEGRVGSRAAAPHPRPFTTRERGASHCSVYGRHPYPLTRRSLCSRHPLPQRGEGSCRFQDEPVQLMKRFKIYLQAIEIESELLRCLKLHCKIPPRKRESSFNLHC